jgi:hypothetical protein
MRDMVRQESIAPDASADAADSRGAGRIALLIRSAKLITPDGEFLCVVRDASESGVSVRLFHPLPPSEPLTLEMPNGDRHALERVWEEKGRAGFRFSGPVDISRIVEGPSRFAKRATRVNLEVPCQLDLAGRRVPAVIRNLSQQGAQIAADERLSLVQRVKIVAAGLPEIAAKVRWRREDSYGLSFEDTFQFAELAELAFALQSNAGGKKVAGAEAR